MVTSQQIHPVGPGGGGKRAKVQGEAASPRTGAPIDRAAPHRFFKDEARARVTRAF
jgi:hypothetical protein